MYDSRVDATGLSMHELRGSPPASAEAAGVDVRRSPLLIMLGLAQLLGVLGLILVARGSGPTVDLPFLSGVALVLAATLLYRELRTRLVARLMRARRAPDASAASTSEWAECQVDRLLWANDDGRRTELLPTPPLS